MNKRLAVSALVGLLTFVSTAAFAAPAPVTKPDTGATIQSCPAPQGLSVTPFTSGSLYKYVGQVTAGVNGEIDVFVYFSGGSPGVDVQLNNGSYASTKTFTSTNSSQAFYMACGTWNVYVRTAGGSSTPGSGQLSATAP